MMLAIENPETGTIRIAMLLDEPPSREYMPGGMGGEPFRRNGPLARALREADMYGYATSKQIWAKDTNCSVAKKGEM